MLIAFEQQYNGSSFPTRITTGTGGQYVLKMRGSGNGAVSLLSEYVINKMAARIGWQVPDVEWVVIPDQFPWVFGTDEFDDIVQKSYGLNLGIAYLPDAVPVSKGEIPALRQETLNQMYSLDLFFINTDRTAAACNLLKTPQGGEWIIDHGSTGFFHRIRLTGTALFPTHFLLQHTGGPTPQYDDRLHDEGLFGEVLSLVPDDLLTEAGHTREELHGLFRTRVSALSEITESMI